MGATLGMPLLFLDSKLVVIDTDCPRIPFSLSWVQTAKSSVAQLNQPTFKGMAYLEEKRLFLFARYRLNDPIQEEPTSEYF